MQERKGESHQQGRLEGAVPCLQPVLEEAGPAELSKNCTVTTAHSRWGRNAVNSRGRFGPNRSSRAGPRNNGARRSAPTGTASAARRYQPAPTRQRTVIYVSLYNLAQAAMKSGHHGEARRHLREGIALSEENQDDANLAYFLEALTIVECAEDAIERVPVLLGAASTLREATENKSYGYYRPDDSLRRDVEDRARQVLRDREYADAFETGRRLGVRDIVSLALDHQA